METRHSDAPTWKHRRLRQTRKLAAWTAAWLVTMAIAVFGPEYLWSSNTLVTIVATLVNVLVGFGMIVANRDHLRSLDELEQRLHLDAMAVTLGIGLVVGLAYSNLDTSDVVPFDAEISHLVVIMSLTYLGALGFLLRRYR